MPLVDTKDMFKKGHQQDTMLLARSTLTTWRSSGYRGSRHTGKSSADPASFPPPRPQKCRIVYLTKLVEAAVEDTGLPVCLHLDHGADFEICKGCVDGGFTSVMIDSSKYPFRKENIELTKRVVDYAHNKGVVVEAELGKLAGVEDAVKVTDQDQAVEFVWNVPAATAWLLPSAPAIAPTNLKANRNWISPVWRRSPTCCPVTRWYCMALLPSFLRS